MKVGKSHMGFPQAEFKDRQGRPCFIGDSSMAFEYCLLLGVKTRIDLNTQKPLDPEGAAKGHIDGDIIELERRFVRDEMIPMLQRFVETGTIGEKRWRPKPGHGYAEEDYEGENFRDEDEVDDVDEKTGIRRSDCQCFAFCTDKTSPVPPGEEKELLISPRDNKRYKPLFVGATAFDPKTDTYGVTLLLSAETDERSQLEGRALLATGDGMFFLGHDWDVFGPSEGPHIRLRMRNIQTKPAILLVNLWAMEEEEYNRRIRHGASDGEPPSEETR